MTDFDGNSFILGAAFMTWVSWICAAIFVWMGRKR